MKRVICLFAAVLLLFCGCSEKPQTVVVAEDDGESETVKLNITADIPASQTPDEAQITCEPLYKDGDVCGFELRFPQTDEVDALLSDPDNLYFGSVNNAKCFISVPMESVRVLADKNTNEFAVTLLFQTGELTGQWAVVSFYVAPRGSDGSSALFRAQKEVRNY